MPLFKLYVKLIYKKEYPLQKVVDKLLSNLVLQSLKYKCKECTSLDDEGKKEG